MYLTGLYYYEQITLATIGLVGVVSLFLFFILKDIDDYPIYIQNKKKYLKNIEYIEKTCLSLPNRVFIVFVTIPIVLSILVLFMQTSYLTSSDFKLMLIIFILSTTTISIANTFVRKELSSILIKLQNTSFVNVRRTSLVKKLLLQLLPVIAVCIVFTYLVVSAVYERNNANIMLDYYNSQFKSEFAEAKFSSIQELKEALKDIELTSDTDVLFIADEHYYFIYQTGGISDFFKKYAKELSEENDFRVYDYYGTSGQGVLYPVQLENGKTYYIGASYQIHSDEIVIFIVNMLAFLAVLCSIVLYTFAKELSKDVKKVDESLDNIAKNNEDFSGKQLYVTSVDEIGDLIKSYNNIQELTMSHLNQIHNSQQTLMERERLASLGQLIGGIAHNLKTPIMSVSGAAEGIHDLSVELDKSIGNPVVTDEDFHAIAADIDSWSNKIQAHMAYMSEVITAVKGQAVAFSSTQTFPFTVEELFKQIDILNTARPRN